jgi:Flp pilus assembly protein TadB
MLSPKEPSEIIHEQELRERQRRVAALAKDNQSKVNKTDLKRCDNSQTQSDQKEKNPPSDENSRDESAGFGSILWYSLFFIITLFTLVLPPYSLFDLIEVVIAVVCIYYFQSRRKKFWSLSFGDVLIFIVFVIFAYIFVIEFVVPFITCSGAFRWHGG